MIKGPIKEEDLTIINIYAPNIGAPQYVKQMLTSMKGEINNNTIIVGDFNTPLTPMDRSVKQKISKKTQTLNDKMDFKTKAIKRDKGGHYIMVKRSIQEEDITIINIYAPNIGAPQYVRQMLTSTKVEINNNTIIVGDFNIPLTPMDRSTQQKINKETQTLIDTIAQLDLIDI